MKYVVISIIFCIYSVLWYYYFWNYQVYDVTKNPFNVVFEYEVGDTQFLIWHKQAHVVFCGSITGDIYVLKVPTGKIL